jgi:hypothetical protein
MTPPDDDEATRAALRRYEEAGSDRSRPMSIDFFVAVPNEAVGHVVEVRTAPMGFTSTVEQDDETGEWTCYCSITIVPTFERVVALERLLDRLARELGGHGDGFGSFGNADQGGST